MSSSSVVLKDVHVNAALRHAQQLIDEAKSLMAYLCSQDLSANDPHQYTETRLFLTQKAAVMGNSDASWQHH